MWLPSFFVLLVYTSGYLFLFFAAICLACGFYYLAELAEEYTSLTKKVLRVAIVAELVFFVLLWLYEGFPFLYCAVGFASHAMYYQLLKGFPFMQPQSVPFIGSVAAFVLSNVAWYRYFTVNFSLFYNYRLSATPSVASFFLICVWMVPLGFFVSLTVNDSVLPGAGLDGPSAARDPDAKDKKARNLVAASVQQGYRYIQKLLGRPQNREARGSIGSL